jgi:putative addiction module component (TIGR02574 family)
VDVSEILRLSARKRLEMVEAIWDSLAAEPGNVSIPASHARELKRRLQDYKLTPGGTLPWEEVKAETLKKLVK